MAATPPRDQSSQAIDTLFTRATCPPNAHLERQRIMPQTRFLGRRWRLATDSLPLLFYPFLRAVSIVLFILLLSLVGVTLTSNYECEGFGKVAVAMYGMTVVYFLEVIVSILLVRLGWRGGPLNERKRMPQMSVVVHVWFVVEVFKLFFTIWGIVVVYSPSIASQCWSSNPCDSYFDQLPKVCVPGATGDIQLTDECQIVFRNKKKYGNCFERWAEFGAVWMLDNFESTNNNPPYANFSNPGTVACQTGVQWDQDQRLSDINPFDNKKNIFVYIGEELERIDEEQREQSPENMSLVDVLPHAYQILMTDFINNGASNNMTSDIPWNVCLSGTCRELLQNSCTQWRDFIELPDTHRLAGWFAAVMFISLGECALTGLIFFISFNAFPDYENQESWEGLLSGAAKRLGYGGDLQTTSTDNGVDALVGIGRLLFTLFGGADLDVTDVILGIYLVHLRQKWKRKIHALSFLAKHGYKGQEPSVSVWRSKLTGFILFPLFIDGYYTNNRKKDSAKGKACTHVVPSDEETAVEGPEGSTLIGDLLSQEFSCELNDIRKENTGLDGQDDISGNVLMLQHSFLRLQSCDSSLEGDAAAIMNTKRIALTKQRRALITPLNLKHVKFQTDETCVPMPEDIVTMYLGNGNPMVEVEQLEDLLHFLPFARASYALIKCKWRSCIEPEWKHRVLGNMVHISRSCLPKSKVSSYFQRRNMKEILRMVNIPFEDILYASYSSNPLGEIPYLIMLDASTKNVCISMRGTAGVADLITDLLSSPAIVSSDLDSQTKLYAHAGMTSSARAMVAEFKAKGIWSALQDPTGTENGLKYPPSCPEDENDTFSLSRALKMIQEAICVKGYGLVITGHSLGAAVACLVASEMRSINPYVRCFAFNPPGGLLDENLRKDSETFCTSVVCGQDAISRMSIGTMKRLIDDMMLALASCKRPKLSILLDSMAGRYSNSDAATHIFNRLDEIEPYIIDILVQYLQKSKMHRESVDDQPMYPPGNIVFLRPYGDMSQSSSITWDAVWICAHGTLSGNCSYSSICFDSQFGFFADLIDEGILLSKATFRHHQLVHTLEALHHAVKVAKQQQAATSDTNHSNT